MGQDLQAAYIAAAVVFDIHTGAGADTDYTGDTQVIIDEYVGYSIAVHLGIFVGDEQRVTLYRLVAASADIIY